MLFGVIRNSLFKLASFSYSVKNPNNFLRFTLTVINSNKLHFIADSVNLSDNLKSLAVTWSPMMTTKYR